MTTFGSAQITTQQVIETTAAVRGVRVEEARKIATARAWLDHSGEVTPAGQKKWLLRLATKVAPAQCLGRPTNKELTYR